MKKLLLIILLMLTNWSCGYEYTTGSEPDRVVGLDLLGLAKIPPSVIIPYLKKGIALGVLDKTFGDPIPNLKLLLNTKKVKLVRVHLNNCACVRNNNCEDLDWISFERLPAWKELMLQYPNVNFIFSPCLEHDEFLEVYEDWKDKIINILGEDTGIVCNALTGECPAFDIIEKHYSTTSDIVSNDGINLAYSYANTFCKDSKICFYWCSGFNLRSFGTFVPPLTRTFDKLAFIECFDEFFPR